MNPPLLQNILAQPDALRSVASHQFGEGRQALIRSADLLRSSKRIVLTGMGASLSACIPLSYFFADRGVPAEVVETSELLYFRASAVDSGTAVVLVSRSGESVEATRLLPLLKERSCEVVGVVNVPQSTIATHAAQAVLLGSPPDELVAIQTYTASVAVLLLLGAAYFNELDYVRSELDKTIETLSRWMSERFTGPEFFETASPLYLLGRGASLASVGAGALLFHEVAKTAAVGMSAAQFRHGPVEVVTPQFRAVIFGSQAKTKELDAALAEDLVNRKSAVCWIGPPPANSTIDPLCPWPAGVPDRFAPIFEIIPLQLAAYRLAQARGIPLGQFRFAPAITLSEKGFM